MDAGSAPTWSALAVCPLGLEAVAADEMRTQGLSVTRVAVDEGTVSWRASLEEIARANLHLRTVERITVEVGEFRALHFAEFRRKAAGLEWERWLRPGQPVLARVTSRASRLYHERGLAERLLAAIGDRLGEAPPPAPASALDDPGCLAQLVVVRLLKDRCLLRVDSSGPRLHRRGYRLATARAPLRESLASALLRFSGWREGSALADPFCGSGTFVIEAALRERSIAPGLERGFACERWPDHDPRTMERLRREARAAIHPVTASAPVLLGSDRDGGAVRAAGENAQRAGVAESVRFLQQSLSDLEPGDAEPGWIVTNPPFGHRISTGRDLRDLGARFGQVLRERFGGWRVTVLAGDGAFARAAGLRWNEGPWVSNGGLRARVLTTSLVR